MDASCHYCERPADFAVTLRSGATEDALVHRQRLCEVHDAIVSSLRSVMVLERRPWYVLPPDERRGTIIGAEGTTIVRARTGVLGRLRSLAGR